MQALEVRHVGKVGELEGEVTALQNSQAAMQATLATRLEESQLREQVCNTTCVLDLSKLCSRHAGAGYPLQSIYLSQSRLEALCHALKLEQEITSCTATFTVMLTSLTQDAVHREAADMCSCPAGKGG